MDAAFRLQTTALKLGRDFMQRVAAILRHDEKARLDSPPLLLVAQASSLLLIAALIQIANPGVTDVSLLIAIGERVLNGERLYVDILETNPPASVLIYLPAVWIARHVGIQAEYILLIQMIAGLAMAWWFVHCLLARHQLLGNATHATTAAFVAFAILAGNSFAQREHVGVIALLPVLAIIMCRTLPNARISKVETLVAAMAAGLAVSIKPHFAAAILLPQLYLCCRTRSARPLFCPENRLILAVFLAYVGSVFLLFPAYWTNVFPIVVEVYRPARISMLALTLLIIPFIVSATTYLCTARSRILRIDLVVPVLAAAGFLIGYFEQGKGWQYHSYPAVALLLYVVLKDALCWWQANRKRSQPPPYHLIRIAAVVALLVSTALRFMPIAQPSHSLEPFIREISSHPRILAISGDLGISHPLIRRVNGTWSGTVVSQWISEAATREIYRRRLGPDSEDRRRLETWIAKDRSILVADIRKAPPDVLLIDLRKKFLDWKAWVQADPELKQLMSNYVLKAQNKDVELYVRRDL